MTALSNFLGDEFFFPHAVTPHNDFAANHMFMIALMSERSKANKQINFLEVGSWCGYSALIWAQAIKEFFGGKGMLTCIDTWAPYFSAEDKKAHQACQEMDGAAKTGAGYEVFLHNMRIAQEKFGVQINSICSPSDSILPLLREAAFDIVYLDAAHSYEPVKRDLPACARLVKEGGILCGDDLEVQLHDLKESVVSDAIKNANTDSCILDHVSNRTFHPGVTLAVGEYLGPVSKGGHSFWAMRKKNGAFERIVSLVPDRVFKPAHLNIKDRDEGFDKVLKDFSDGKIKWQV